MARAWLKCISYHNTPFRPVVIGGKALNEASKSNISCAIELNKMKLISPAPDVTVRK
jgi:hypothetical protein